MTTNILDQIKGKFGQIAVLIDPEKLVDFKDLNQLVKKAEFAQIDYFFVGGSTASGIELKRIVNHLSKRTKIPVVIFPGNYTQVSEEADALLYLSLLSGRNPEFLIGQHVQNAAEIKAMKIEVIPTAYLLIDGGKQSAVAYVSQTTPLPQDQLSLIVNTAIAGELQGKALLYLDAGSGADISVNPKIISKLKERSNLPIIVGGGLKTITQIKELKEANVIVIGNKIEEDINFLLDLKNLHSTESI